MVIFSAFAVDPLMPCFGLKLTMYNEELSNDWR